MLILVRQYNSVTRRDIGVEQVSRTSLRHDFTGENSPPRLWGGVGEGRDGIMQKKSNQFCSGNGKREKKLSG